MAQMDDDELQRIYTWVDEVPLSRPKRNIARDFADGVLTAEIVHHYFPRIVEVHNYPSANSYAQKMYNWQTLNARVNKNEEAESLPQFASFARVTRGARPGRRRAVATAPSPPSATPAPPAARSARAEPPSCRPRAARSCGGHTSRSGLQVGRGYEKARWSMSPHAHDGGGARARRPSRLHV